MKITSSYGIEIKQMNKISRPAVVIYNDAISFCIDVFEKEWLNIKKLDTARRKRNISVNIYRIQKCLFQH